MDISSNILQCGFVKEFGENELNCTVSYIGPDRNIEEKAINSRVGSSISGNEIMYGQTYYKGVGKVTACKTTKLEDDRTRLDISYKIPKQRTSISDEEHLITETWGETMTQYSFPLYRYCAPSASLSSSEYGDVVALKAWENEEISAKNFYKFLYENERSLAINMQLSDYHELSGRTKEIAQKMMGGTEEVLRFYPNAVRVSQWDEFMQTQGMNERASKLNKIDQTPATQFPWTISWLKTGFDWQQNNDGTWTLTETWQGVQGGIDGWDQNLYGDGQNRWSFYYQPNVQQ